MTTNLVFWQKKFSQCLELNLENLAFIQQNKYCSIFRAQISNESPRIIKHYYGNDTVLAQTEAKALHFYHQLARENTDLLDSGPCVFHAPANLLSIGFVPGKPMNELLQRARFERGSQHRLIHLTEVLGRLLRKMRQITAKPQEKTSPFMHEYLAYCSNRLQQSWFGRFLTHRRFAEAGLLSAELEKARPIPSFVHGDLVCKNLHIDENKIGLIDFANSNFHSHPLNDIYNFHFAIANMWLPQPFRQCIYQALQTGFGTEYFAPPIRRFYYEYQRRRWLMLKLLSGSAKDTAQGIIGALTFARHCSYSASFP